MAGAEAVVAIVLAHGAPLAFGEESLPSKGVHGLLEYLQALGLDDAHAAAGQEADRLFGIAAIDDLRTGVVGRLAPTLRYGLGTNAVLETASDFLLGDNALNLRPIAALRENVAGFP